MSVFKIDLTDTSTSLLLSMLIDSEVLRQYLDASSDNMLVRSGSLVNAYNELHDEIDRRIPIPGKRYGAKETDCPICEFGSLVEDNEAHQRWDCGHWIKKKR